MPEDYANKLALEPYPTDDGCEWLTLPQHEALTDLGDVFDGAEFDAKALCVWVPEHRYRRLFHHLEMLGLAFLETEPTVFRAGHWIDLRHPALTGD